jgi:TPR repeat protein
MGEGQESQARAAFKAGAELGSDECKAALARWDDYDAERLAAQAIEAGAYEEAVRLLRPLAERNSEYALLNLGWIYETGAAGATDKDAAQTYYGLASAGGSGSAYLSLGRLFLSKNEETQARAAFEAGAELGSGECKSELARLDDNDVERLAAQAINTGAYEEALRLLRPLAEGDSQNALLSLGWIYETGAAGASDKNAAHLCYERAASKGSASACFELGRFLLSQGEESQARSAFEAGAERGDISSMSKLGRMMVEGRGGHIDIDAGSEWLKKAAAQGHIFAQRTLLNMEERNAKSVLERLSIKIKIALLAIKGAKEISKDPDSDRVR